MNEIEQYQTIKNLCLQQMADLRAEPKPSYELDGQRVSWDNYYRSLQSTVDWCDRKLLGLEACEVTSVGVT
jgi:hypothetical protein